MSPILELTSSVLRSRLGWIFFAAHCALAACAYALHLAARPAPATLGEEPVLFWVVYWLNSPMIFLTAFIVWPVMYERRYGEYGILQWLAVGFMVFCVLAQWWLLGYLFERLLKWSNKFES